MNHLFPYRWVLSDNYKTADKNGLKVFSCFACGGGSTMGYKLAGFDVIGFNEIDQKMAECYIENHNPKYKYTESIRDFKKREDLPDELYNLDILDGSPPCSSFSKMGNREKDWGKKKKFREGQQEQILDTLFLDFLDVAEKLQPKVIIAENVKGLMIGKAKEFLAKIIKRYDSAGYRVWYQLLNASKMGVPQKRERIFLYAIRKDLLKYVHTFGYFRPKTPLLDLSFCEKEIATESFYSVVKKKETQTRCKTWGYNRFLKLTQPAPTITAGGMCWFDENYYLDDETIKLIGSFPIDYNFHSNKVRYLVGMSVPPVMMAQIATRIKRQWFDKFPDSI